MKACDPKNAATCRGNPNDRSGDYECRAWNNFGLSAGPICEFGSNVPCDIFPASSDCASVGLSPNDTQMTCRAPSTQQPAASANDPAGFCYDNTPSGPPPGKWGAVCDLAAPGCQAGLRCVPYGTTKGFCSKKYTPLAVCPSTPAGTWAASTLEYQGDHYCMFMCKNNAGETYACPPGLTCETSPNPPGSTQFLCAAP
jgi:hypothetical protein